MSYRLTKEQLKESAYYCAAGIDLQPVLRFGDIISDFIYVTVGLSKKELIAGLENFINDLNPSLGDLDAKLEILSVSDINLKEIEHKRPRRLVQEVPDYFTREDFENYQNSIKPFYHRKDDYYLEFNLLLKIGHLERNIRLFHITGEALATYDVIFRKQNIAPKVFISIQTGLIEIPEKISNRMFELSSAKPKVWLRGVWVKSEDSYNESYNDYKPNVFNVAGVFNEQIGEYRGWKVISSSEINSIFNASKTYRIVKAYGLKEEWQNVGTVEFQSQGLIVNKKFEKYNSNLAPNYHFNKVHFPLSGLFELHEEIKVFSNENPEIKEILIAILPSGYESFEVMLNEFMTNYDSSKDFNLTIDIYYINKSDLHRVF
jgi:hypothetical protein